LIFVPAPTLREYLVNTAADGAGVPLNQGRFEEPLFQISAAATGTALLPN